MELRFGVEYDMWAGGDKESNLVSVSANYRILDKVDAFVRFDKHDTDTKYTYNKNIYKQEDDKNKLSSNYFITGIILNCGNGLSVAPNIKMTSYESDKDSVTEYKINIQFKF